MPAAKDGSGKIRQRHAQSEPNLTRISPCLPYLPAFPCLQDVGGPSKPWVTPRRGRFHPRLGVTHALSRGSGRNRKDKKKLFLSFSSCGLVSLWLPHALPAAPPPRFFPRLYSGPPACPPACPHAYFGPSGIGPSPEISRRAAASVRPALPPRHVRPSALTPTFIFCRRACGPAALLHARAISSTASTAAFSPLGFCPTHNGGGTTTYGHSHGHEQARVRLEAPSHLQHAFGSSKRYDRGICQSKC